MNDRDPTSNVSWERESGGYSLASLALIVTVCVVFLASTDIRFYRELLGRPWSRDLEDLLAGFTIAAVCGSMVGLFCLFFTPFSWRKLYGGPMCGALAGVAAAMVLIAPAPLWRTLLAIVLLLATINLLRLGYD
jgi:uncharacterized membrane protein